MKIATLKHQFVASVPEKAEEGVLYVSLPYRTAIHKCCCGCGHEVVTPFSPTDWRLTFDGVSVSLHPSIGNWSLPCRSHYWIQGGKIGWAEQWSDAKVTAGRAHDRWRKEGYYGRQAESEQAVPIAEPSDRVERPRPSWWKRFVSLRS